MIRVKQKLPLIVSAILVVVSMVAYNKLLINISPSLKEGLYIKISGDLHRGDTVSFCLHEPYMSIALKNGYIAKGIRCHGSDPLLKKIVAIPGDHVILSDNSIIINGITYAYKTLYYSNNQLIKVYPRGDYPNTSGYWLIGTNAINSWDSRYWGPINKNQIIAKVKPLMTW